MKKILIVIVLLLGSITMMAQHMNFLGKPLGCDINTFKQRMAQKGYKSIGETEANIYSFNGIFGGDEVEVCACVTPKSKIVFQIIIVYKSFVSHKYDASSVSTQDFKFNELTKAFSKKYGEPKATNKKFSFWELPTGTITIIKTGEEEDITRNLLVSYEDEASDTINNNESESDY